MKLLTTAVPYHTAIWLGIWFSVFDPVPAVANITAVFMSLNAVCIIFLAGLVLVWLDSGTIEKLTDSYPRSPVTGWLFGISAYAQAVTLIATGGWWLVLGTAWFVAVALVHVLKTRAHSLQAESTG